MHGQPLSDDLVGAIMVKLGLTYGHRFTRGSDYDADTVRAHWAHELSGVSEAGVRYALAHLPESYPPTCLGFRALAACRPSDDLPQLPAPPASAKVRASAKEALAGLRESLRPPEWRDPLAWAHRIVNEPLGKSRRTLEIAKDALRSRGGR